MLLSLEFDKGRLDLRLIQVAVREKLRVNDNTTLYNVCSVFQGMFSTLGGGVFSTSDGWDTMSTLGRYHDSCGEQIDTSLWYWKPRCTEHPSDALMVSPHMNHDIPPHESWYPLNVLIIPQCTHNISPMYSCIPPQCTYNIPPMYWTSPDLLMISPDVFMVFPRCNEHTLYMMKMSIQVLRHPSVREEWCAKLNVTKWLLRSLSGPCDLTP